MNRKLFTNFAPNGILKRLLTECEECVVFIVDVSANADGAFRDQTLLARFFTTNIMKNAFSICNHNIRDDLFEAKICFSIGAGHEAIIFRIKNDRQIAAYISTETLKDTKLFEKRTRENKNFFICSSHIELRIPETKIRSQNLEKEISWLTFANQLLRNLRNFAL